MSAGSILQQVQSFIAELLQVISCLGRPRFVKGIHPTPKRLYRAPFVGRSVYDDAHLQSGIAILIGIRRIILSIILNGQTVNSLISIDEILAGIDTAERSGKSDGIVSSFQPIGRGIYSS